MYQNEYNWCKYSGYLSIICNVIGIICIYLKFAMYMISLDKYKGLLSIMCIKHFFNVNIFEQNRLPHSWTTGTFWHQEVFLKAKPPGNTVKSLEAALLQERPGPPAGKWVWRMHTTAEHSSRHSSISSSSRTEAALRRSLRWPLPPLAKGPFLHDERRVWLPAVFPRTTVHEVLDKKSSSE